MKGKILTAGAAMVAAVCFCLGLAACGDEVCEHEYTADNVCALCGDQWEYTEGLNYVYDEETDTYSVGKNGYVNGDVVLPYGYQGKFVTKIGESAFEGCDGLASVEIPDSVVSIGKDAFHGCTGLASVALSDGVTSIGEYAFYNCYGMRGALAIPESVTSIGEHAFEYCGLTRVDITDLTAWCKIDFGGEYANPLAQAHHLYLDGEEVTTLTVPQEITEMKAYTFYDCEGLTDIEIPDGMTVIGGYAFYHCTGLAGVTIPDSVTEIGEYAFAFCDGLTAVTIGRGVKEIGRMAFANSYKLIEVWNRADLHIPAGEYTNSGIGQYAKYVYTGNEASKQTATDDGYIFYVDGAEIYLLGYRGTETALTLPAKSPSGKEYKIYQCAFNGCDGPASVTIGNGVTAIGEEAFKDCDGLTGIDIPDSVVSIGFGAFYDCEGLTRVTIGNGVTSIGEGAFWDCSGLTSVTIGNGVKEIGRMAFYQCTALTSVTIGSGVTSIGYEAFYQCTALTDFQFRGTIAKWQAIEKGSWWAYDTGDYTVTCTDGTVDRYGHATDF